MADAWLIRSLSLVVCFLSVFAHVTAQSSSCELTSFLDVIDGNVFSDTSIFKQAVKLSGYEDKLPSPSSNIAITLLVPTNGAWLKLMGGNFFFLPSVSSFGDDLPATVLFNTMLGSVSPDQISQYSAASPGSSPSVYGLLSGKPGYDIRYWAEVKDDGRTAYYFSSQVNTIVSETYRPVQACSSWLYFTNNVLVPAESGKLSDVDKVTIPESLPWGPSSSPPSPASPSSSEPPSPTPIAAQNATKACIVPDPSLSVLDALTGTTMAPPPTTVTNLPSVECNTTFQNAAQEAGLTLLSLVAGNLEDTIPDPKYTSTVFAPSDAAFTGMLSDLGLTIPDALTLGDKLISVLLYHVHPGEALSTEELNQRQTLNTELGARMDDVESFSIGVQPGGSGAAPTLLSKRGDTATITNTLQVCGTTVHVIDKVLLPATTVEELPIAPPMSTDATETTNGTTDPMTSATVTGPAAVMQKGMAMGVGAMKSCSMILEAAGVTLTTVTDDAGLFMFDNIPRCATTDGLVILPSTNQTEGCVDSLTGLSPAYELAVSLDLLGDGIGEDQSLIPSIDAPFLVTPLSALLSSPALPNGTVADLLGFSSMKDMILGGTVSDNAMGINSQALVSALLLGTTVQGYDGVDLTTGVDAVNDFLAANLDSRLSLSDPSTIEQVLNATLVSPINEAQAAAIAASTASLNGVLIDTWYSQNSMGLDVKRNVTSQVTVFAQQQVAPDILNLANGSLSVEDFEMRTVFQKANTEIAAPAPGPADPVGRLEAASGCGWAGFMGPTTALVAGAILRMV